MLLNVEVPREILEVVIELDNAVLILAADALRPDGTIGGGDAKEMPGLDPVIAVAVPLKLGSEGVSLHAPEGTRIVTVTIE